MRSRSAVTGAFERSRSAGITVTASPPKISLPMCDDGAVETAAAPHPDTTGAPGKKIGPADPATARLVIARGEDVVAQDTLTDLKPGEARYREIVVNDRPVVIKR